MKVVFLDMDGVLVTRRCVSEPRDARARRLPSRRGETKFARPLVILHSPSPSAFGAARNPNPR